MILTINILGINHELNKRFSSKLHLIDLAGSERIFKSLAEGDWKKEAIFINKSLSNLGNVLNGLLNQNQHIQYRDSKLTHYLKESLGGDSKTLLLIQVSPNPDDVPETLSTL